MRRALALILVLVLAACGKGEAVLEPFAETQTPASLAQRFFPPDGWAWGYLQLGEGLVQRYGVAAPNGVVPKAQVLILPDYGESAETWFETARDLNARGYTVWVLDAQGQGGSGRLTAPRDLGHATSLLPDVAAVRAMSRAVIRPSSRTPLYILGAGSGAMIALRAAEDGVAPRGVILSALPGPPASRPQGPLAGFMRPDTVRASGGEGWRREGKDAFAEGLTHDRWRGGVTHAWQITNPDLRMGGPSYGWQKAMAAFSMDTRRRAAQARVPVLALSNGASDCTRLPTCRIETFPRAGRSLHLERDDVRTPWLEAIDSFIRADLADHAR